MDQLERAKQLGKEFLEFEKKSESLSLLACVIGIALAKTIEDMESGLSLSEEGEKAMFHSVYTVMGDERAKLYEKIPEGNKA